MSKPKYKTGDVLRYIARDHRLGFRKNKTKFVILEYNIEKDTYKMWASGLESKRYSNRIWDSFSRTSVEKESVCIPWVDNEVRW